MGANGTGKSWFCNDRIKQSKKRSLIVTMSGAPEIWHQYPKIKTPKEIREFKGIAQVMTFQLGKKPIDVITKNFSNGSIIFDDCKPYIKSNLEATPGLVQLLADFRHRKIDVFFVLHSPTQVPPEVWSHAKYAFVGKTVRPINVNTFPIDQAEELARIQKEVNTKFKTAYAKQNNSHYGMFKMLRL